MAGRDRYIRVYDAHDEMARYVSEYQMSGCIVEDINVRSYWRYITTWNVLQQATGRLTIQEGMDLLNDISLKVSEDVWWTTQYSVVYDLTSGAIQVATDRNLKQVYQFQLKMATHP